MIIMKRYKPTYKAPTPYAQRHRFLKKRRNVKSKPSEPYEFDNFVSNDIDEDMELNSCSMYDCTGLIPTAIQNRAEAEAYESLYPYIAPAAGKGE